MSAPGYLRRSRLTDQLRDARVVVLEGGGGSGKTSLALELADALDLAPVHVPLRPDTSVDAFAARVSEALQNAGHARAAAAASIASTAEELAAGLAAVEGGALLIVDDVHLAGDEVVDRLVRLISTLSAPSRMAVAGRRVADDLRDTGATVLLDADLALTPDECAELAHGADIDGAAAASVHAITGGWVAPTLTALEHLGVHPDRTAVRSVQQVVTQTLAELRAEDRAALGIVSRLPRVNGELLAALGALGAVDAARDVGVPVRELGGGWFVLANPFNDGLQGADELDTEALTTAAQAYADSGELLLGADLLHRHVGDEAAAELLARAGLDDIVGAHGASVLDLVSQLADDAVAANPGALLAGSMVAFVLAQPDRRRELVDRLLDVTAGGPGEALARAEDLLERVWRHPDPTTLRSIAHDAERLEGAYGADDQVAARLAEVAARVHAFQHGDDPEGLHTAWSRCARLWERAGARTQAARTTIWHAVTGAWPNGRYDQALELVNRALAMAGSTPPLRLLALVFRGMFLVDLGRYAEAQATFDQALAIAHALRADVRRAHIAWFSARMASQRGDAAATLAAVRDAEAADVNDAAGGVFFAADAATLLARVGELDQARPRLAHALANDPGGSEKVPVAAMDVAARGGDLEGALRWYRELGNRQPTEVRDRWRHRLLLAYAAHVSGDARARRWAVDAFDAAGALGHPELPFIREPTVARELVQLAADAGSACAQRLLRDGVAHIQLLGGFRVEVPGAPTIAITGTQAQALKYVAVNAGRVQQDALIEALWPDVEPRTGRQRLRVVLSRLRSEAGDLVVREGDVVALARGVTVDATRFDDLAQRALIEDDLTHAEAAINAYGGPLLPDDPYEPWAAIERDRLNWRYLALLDRLATAAVHSGDLERALSLLYVGIDEEPEVEDRYVRAARLLCDQGRHSRARALLERASRVLDAQGLPISAELRRLRDQLTA